MKKRFICVLMGIVLMLTNVLSVNALDVIGEDAIVVPGNGEGIDVISKNLITGEVTLKTYEEVLRDMPQSMINSNDLSAVILSQSSTVDPNVIIGSDDRSRVNTTIAPYSAIAYVLATFPDGYTVDSTAWLIGNNVALTAAHCIYDEARGGWATVMIFPGYDDDMETFGMARSIGITMSQAYAINKNTPGADWALIALDRNIGLQAGKITFGYASIEAIRSLTGNAIRVSGYPSVYPENTQNINGYQYQAVGGFLSFDTELNPEVNGDYNYATFNHTADATGGQSGAPVMIATTNAAIGLHYNGADDIYGNGYCNNAIRFTAELCNLFNAYIAEYAISN